MSPAGGEGTFYFVPSSIIVPFWGSWMREMGPMWNYMANETLQYLCLLLLNVPSLVWFFPPKNVETSFEPSYSRHEESWCYCIKMEFL